jgi:transmembrane sensor
MKPSQDKKSQCSPYQLRDLQNAIAPFEELLLANLPTKDEVLARYKQRKLKKTIGQSLLLLCLALGCVYWLDPCYQQVQYSTQAGEHKRIHLEDGSQLDLFGDTQIRVAYHLRAKQLSLNRGEASFRVQHIANTWLKPLERRFVVSSGDVQIEDIGTIFNVRQVHPEHTQVRVLQGQVRLSLGSDRAAGTLDLYTGQTGEYQQHRLMLLPQHSSAVVARQHQQLYFDAIDLASAIKQLQGYQQFEVTFADAKAKTMQISGRVQVGQAEQFIQLLPQISALEVKQIGHGRWLIASRALEQ